jgi:3-methyladenine DNA glycosylase AlkD
MNFQTNKLLNEIQKELKRNIDIKYRDGAKRFFKEPVDPIGVRSKKLKEIMSKYWIGVKNLKKDEIFGICEQLMTGEFEEKTIGIKWTYKLTKKYDKSDFYTFENWLKKHVSNWAHCDDICTHNIGYLIAKYPELLTHLDKWVVSKNRWFKRASCVSQIYPLSRIDNKLFLNKIFKYSDILINDKDDLVQKGYGWTLKVASKKYQKQVFDYVMKNKKTMPRTALRYAIEKMPEIFKHQAMNKK